MDRYAATVACVALAIVAAAIHAEVVQVEVKEAKLREEPRSLAKPVAQVKLGDQVSVEKKDGAWWQVKPADQSAGWITRNALAAVKTDLKAGEADETGDTGVSKDEQALAYRPFSPEVEEAYREDNPKLADSYVALDRIDEDPAYKVSDEEAATFLAEGQVVAGGGQ